MRRTIGPLLALLTLTGAYLYGFPAPTIAYCAVVVAHVLGGLAATVLLVLLARTVGGQSWPARIGWAATGLGALAGTAIVKTGATLPYQPLVTVHIALSTLGIVVLAAARMARRDTHRSPAEQGFRLRESLRRTAAASAEAVSPVRLLTALFAIPAIAAAARK